MKKIELATLFVLIVVLSSFAQEQSQRVHLKTGEIVTGTILENIEGKVLKLKINDKDVRSFKWEEIDTTYIISKTTIDDWEKTEKFFSRMRSLKDKGYSGVINLGYTRFAEASTDYQFRYNREWSGSNAYIGYYFQFLMAQGYQLNPHFAIRAGSGIEVGKGIIIPIYGEVQFNALKRLFTPILTLSPGYAFCFDRDDNDPEYSYYSPLRYRGGGFFFAGNAGVRYAFASNFAMQWTAGVRYQTVSDDNASATVYGYNLRWSFEF